MKRGTWQACAVCGNYAQICKCEEAGKIYYCKVCAIEAGELEEHEKEKVCPVCGDTFTATPSKRMFYCSRQCAHIGMSREFKIKQRLEIWEAI